MKASLLQNTFVGIPISVACDAGKLSNRYLLNSASQYNKSTESSDKSRILFLKQIWINSVEKLDIDIILILPILIFPGKTNSVLARVNKLGRKTNNFAHEVQEHGMKSFE